MAALATSWLLAGASAARAQVTAEPANAVVFPDPNKFARGLYTEGEIGAVALFGPAGDKVSPGFAVGARLGYDIFRWLAVQAHFLGSTHQLSDGAKDLSGQLLQTYQAVLEGKLTLRFSQTSIFGEGGIGVARLSTNALYVLMVEPQYRVGFTAGGGAGADYHSLSRHFSVGIRGDYLVMTNLSSSRELIATTYLRYTF
jgi:Outer membrane protein beta-barrel domain